MGYEIRPKQVKPLHWGWKNKEIDGRVYVEKPLGRVTMPNLVEAFDFKHPEIIEHKELDGFGTRRCLTGMHSILTTACRFLGTEEALIRLEQGELEKDLREIADHFFLWNERCLRSFPEKVHTIIVGDDIGTSRGMMMSPETYRKKLSHFHYAFVSLGFMYDIPVFFHSDGDISEILPYLRWLGFHGVLYEDIGSMYKEIRRNDLEGVKVVR